MSLEVWRLQGAALPVPKCSGFELQNLSLLPEVDKAGTEQILLSIIEAMTWREFSWPSYLERVQRKELGAFLRKAGLTQRQLLGLLVRVVAGYAGRYGEDNTQVFIDPINGQETVWTHEVFSPTGAEEDPVGEDEDSDS